MIDIMKWMHSSHATCRFCRKAAGRETMISTSRAVIVVGSALNDRCNIIRVGEGVLGAGVAQAFEVCLNRIHLILTVCLIKACFKTHEIPKNRMIFRLQCPSFS